MIPPMLLAGLLGALAALSLRPKAPPGEPERLVLQHVNVVDLERGRILADQSVAIEGERITAVGPADTLAPAPGATRVEGGGRTLIPGLFDMHVHLDAAHADDCLALHVANGVTTVQCMSGSPWHLGLRGQLERRERLGPRLFTTGPTTATLRVHTTEQAERAVREQRAAGYDGVKMYGDGQDTMPVETYRRLVATGHEVGMRIVGHAPRNLPFQVVLEARQDSIDHMEEIVYTEASFAPVLGPWVAIQFGRQDFAAYPELPAAAPDFRPLLGDEIAALAARVRAAGLCVTPTLITFATIQATTDEGIQALLARDELRYVPPTVSRAWVPERARFRNGGWKPNLARISGYLARNAELQGELVRAFHAAGVPLMTGTDAPFDCVVPGFALHDELARFVAAGLTPLEALRCATLVPARFLGLADGSGTIRAGARADLVLLEGDPLADIAATRRSAGVVLRGRWLARETLDATLAGIARRNEGLGARMQAIEAALDAESWNEAAALRATGERDARLDDWFESRLNDEGYGLLRRKRTAEAVSVLRLNCTAFPGSANAWDSLGEACLAAGALEEALEHYSRALELAPDSATAQRQIDRILEQQAGAAR